MSSRFGFPIVVSIVFVAAVGGCQGNGETVASEGDTPPPQDQSVQLVSHEATPAYEGLFDQWEKLQRDSLLSNAKYLEQNYLKRKANPPKDPKGKPVAVTPGNSLHFMGNPNRTMSMPITLALNTFAPHIGGTGDALIGNISIGAARLRLRFDESNTAGSWTLYKAALTSKGAVVERFFDGVGTIELTTEDKKALREAVAKSLKNGGAPNKGKVGTASFEVRPLRLFDKSCITCHTGRKLNDLVAAMLYVAAPEAQD